MNLPPKEDVHYYVQVIRYFVSWNLQEMEQNIFCHWEVHGQHSLRTPGKRNNLHTWLHKAQVRAVYDIDCSHWLITTTALQENWNKMRIKLIVTISDNHIIRSKLYGYAYVLGCSKYPVKTQFLKPLLPKAWVGTSFWLRECSKLYLKQLTSLPWENIVERIKNKEGHHENAHGEASSIKHRNTFRTQWIVTWRGRATRVAAWRLHIH